MTTETYEFLTREHGIAKELCEHCMKREVEIYQCDFVGCYSCWCELVDPKIEIN